MDGGRESTGVGATFALAMWHLRRQTRRASYTFPVGGETWRSRRGWVAHGLTPTDKDRDRQTENVIRKRIEW